MYKSTVLTSCLLFFILICPSCSFDSNNGAKLEIIQNSTELVMGLQVIASTRCSVLSQDSFGELVWKSSKPDVATIEQNGVVVAVGGGVTKITVTDTQSNKRASCKIRVYVMPEDISLSNTTLSLTPNQSYNLRAKILPSANIRKDDKAITWVSSNQNVATVNAKGRVTAVAEGTAEIIAITVNQLTALCEITVEVR